MKSHEETESPWPNQITIRDQNYCCVNIEMMLLVSATYHRSVIGRNEAPINLGPLYQPGVFDSFIVIML